MPSWRMGHGAQRVLQDGGDEDQLPKSRHLRRIVICWHVAGRRFHLVERLGEMRIDLPYVGDHRAANEYGQLLVEDVHCPSCSLMSDRHPWLNLPSVPRAQYCRPRLAGRCGAGRHRGLARRPLRTAHARLDVAHCRRSGRGTQRTATGRNRPRSDCGHRIPLPQRAGGH